MDTKIVLNIFGPSQADPNVSSGDGESPLSSVEKSEVPKHNAIISLKNVESPPEVPKASAPTFKKAEPPTGLRNTSSFVQRA